MDKTTEQIYKALQLSRATFIALLKFLMHIRMTSLKSYRKIINDTMKKFRVNVVIVYYKNTNLNNFQPPLHNIFKSLAWLHSLEYAIETDYKSPLENESELYGQTDLIYFRSTSNSRIEGKAFRKLIMDIFHRSRMGLFQGAEIFYQLQKALPQYPFPKNYLKPLNYPYLEVHQDGTTRVCIPAENIQELDINSSSTIIN